MIKLSQGNWKEKSLFCCKLYGIKFANPYPKILENILVNHVIKKNTYARTENNAQNTQYFPKFFKFTIFFLVKRNENTDNFGFSNEAPKFMGNLEKS